MDIPINQDYIEAVALISVRIAVFLIIAPPFSYTTFPMQLKAGLSVMLAMVIAPTVAHGHLVAGTGPFLLDIVIEATTGAVLGFLVYVTFAAIQSAGALLDSFGGFQAAQQYDPEAQVDGAQFSRLYQMTALALMFASDGYQLVIGGLVRSFHAVPLTVLVDLSTVAPTLAESITQLLVAALQIAGPIIVVLFLANVALGLLSRVAPALNAYTLGPPAFALIAIVLGAISFVALPDVVENLANQAGQLIAGGS
jgi:flagellar biosynthetic protein FliR